MKPHRLDRTMGWRAGIAAALAVGGLLATPSTGDAVATDTVAAGDPGRPTARFIVQSDGDRALDVGRAAVDLGGRVVGTQQALGTVVVDLPPGTANRLRRVSGVGAMTADGQVRLQGAGYGPTGEGGDMTNVARRTGATTYWQHGFTGQGVDVALLDSGVVPVEGLMTANKLVIGPDLSFEARSPRLAHLDTFGHGTHMAGIIAGRDAGSPPADGAADRRFVGMAPEARIVSLKLADGQGRTTVAQVLAGIDWVVTHAHDDGMNIRVLNLSFAADSGRSSQLDLLAFAAEVAWAKGIVVVAAAGNGGSGTGLASPASSPAVIAVGSVDSTDSDDSVSPWSQSGSYVDGKRSPDLVAPGSSIVSLRAKGSTIDTRYAASGAVGDRFFRGSGTSQSAAIVSGAAALVLSQRPGLSPDQVRDVLRRSARPLTGTSSDAQGAGRLDLAAAYGTPGLSVPTTRAAVRAGEIYDRLSAARGKNLRQRYGLAGALNGGWSESPLSGATWAGDHWAGATWAGATWAGATWAGATWAGATWAGATWAGDHWAGATWAGATWAGATWAGATWASSDWR